LPLLRVVVVWVALVGATAVVDSRAVVVLVVVGVGFSTVVQAAKARASEVMLMSFFIDLQV